MPDPAWTDPLDTSFALRCGGRWKAPRSYGVLYLCADVTVAAANARRAYEGEIATLFDLLPQHRPDLQLVDVPPMEFVDAVTDRGRRSLRLPSTYPHGASWARCRAIAARAYERGVAGIVCRTADATARTNVVIPGEELAVFDRATAHVRPLQRVRFADWYPLETGRAPAWGTGRRSERKR